MKPHEETWRVDLSDSGVFRVDTTEGERVAIVGDSRERAKLAAQAPAMARLLLKLEWEAEDETGLLFCATCAGQPQDQGGSGHRKGCEWRAVLRDAGVIK